MLLSQDHTANIGRNAVQNQVCLQHQYITQPLLNIYSLSFALQSAISKVLLKFPANERVSCRLSVQAINVFSFYNITLSA